MLIDRKIHKCQVQGSETQQSFIDNLYVVFSNSFAVRWVAKATSEHGGEKLRVLEIGCYDGRLIKQMMDAFVFFAHYTGVDINQKYLDRAPKRKDSEFLQLNFGMVLQAIPSLQYDVAIALETMEHLNSTERLIAGQNFRDHANPGALVLLGMPINYNNTEFHGNEEKLGHFDIPTYEEIVGLMEANDFQLREFFTSYSVGSHFRIPKETKQSDLYQRLAAHLGTTVARAVFMSTSAEPTGGGHFVFEKC